MIEKFDDNNMNYWMGSNKALYILFYSESIPNTDNVKEIFKEFDLKFDNKIQILFSEIDSPDCKKIMNTFNMKTLPGAVFIKRNKIYASMAGPASRTHYEDIVKTALMEMIKEQKK